MNGKEKCVKQPVNNKEKCEACGKSVPVTAVKVGTCEIKICTNCMTALYNKLGQHISSLSQTPIWHLVKCDDEWEIVPMVITCYSPYGSIRKVKDKEPQIWNIFAESNYTYLYERIENLGKTWFLTEDDAEEARKERSGNE